MPNYQNGKIYCIRSHQTDDIYIGSTIKKLSSRMTHHRHHFKKKHNYITSYELMKYEDDYIELLEAFPCNNVEELRKKEGEYIRNTNCVNKQIAGRCSEEYNSYYNSLETTKERKKIYRNKPENKEKQKIYRDNPENKEKAKARFEKYYSNLDNKEKANERAKTHNKKPEIIEKRKQKYNCECGGKYQYSSKESHMRCKKHIDYFNNNLDN